jgi:hypothetical protein
LTAGLDRNYHLFKPGQTRRKTVGEPHQLGPVEAYEAIQRLLAEGDTIGLTTHARERCLARNCTIDDIRKVLETGTVSPRAEWDDRFQNWKYSVTGFDCDHDPLVVVIGLQPSICRITVITVKDIGS